MKKVKSLIALSAVIAMMAATTVCAAPSPVAGTVVVTTPGGKGAGQATVKQASQKELTTLTNYIAQNAAASGMIPSVKATVSIVAPADYKGGDIPTVIAAAGLPNGAANVFAYILLPNGKTVVIPCTVKNGYVGFVAPAFGTVSIVQLTPAAAAMAAGTFGSQSAASAVPAKLH